MRQFRISDFGFRILGARKRAGFKSEIRNPKLQRSEIRNPKSEIK